MPASGIARGVRLSCRYFIIRGFQSFPHFYALLRCGPYKIPTL